MPIGMEVGLSPGDFVLDGMGAQSTLHKKGRSPQFSSHVYCGQTSPWIKMSLGTEVAVFLHDVVLDGDQLPSPKGHSPPILGHCSL